MVLLNVVGITCTFMKELHFSWSKSKQAKVAHLLHAFRMVQAAGKSMIGSKKLLNLTVVNNNIFDVSGKTAMVATIRIDHNFPFVCKLSNF